ncbi:MAG: hypothetical protein K8R18_14300 [Parvibaculum sp.]|uniref:hypothetical protein n=1 Tax=Parvibaculum sp. TaxID=2024848 RepID=UPI0025E1F438|nr:hypothetical protein [Parvibaculum sp.]MCE9650789.1 hypothetical protein [Parvibaculum sp.]
MKALVLGLTALALCASAARAADPAPASATQCELTCDYRAGNGARQIVSCTPRMDARQCAAIADHKNLNDAYPAKMSCAAKLVQACTEARKF